MTKIILPGDITYKVLNKQGTSTYGFEQLTFTPSGEFIGDLENMYNTIFTNVGFYPYWSKNMKCESKLLVPPLDNNVESKGIKPIPKDGIYLSFTFPKRDVKNKEDLRTGIEEILLHHHKDWQVKRRRQGRGKIIL
ncbi:MAG: hypothetical protein ACLFPL_01455 [Candidatus Nanoarchaeia archaeon]